MKIKSILSIAAFSTAFILSAAFAGLFVDKSEIIQTNLVITPTYNTRPTSCFGHRKTVSADAAKISRILQVDDENGRGRDAKARLVGADYNPPFADDSSFNDFADATARYAEKSGKMEAADLSPAFNSAWRKHMKAWRDYADFLQAMKIASVRLELGEDAFADFNREYDSEINTSWYEVLRVADENGVDTRNYRGLYD